MREITLTSPLTQNEVLDLENEIKLKSINYSKQMEWLSVWATIACFSLLYLLRVMVISELGDTDSFPTPVNLQSFAMAGIKVSIFSGAVLCIVVAFYSFQNNGAPSKIVFCNKEKEDELIGLISKYKITETALFMKEIYSQKRDIALIEYEFLNKYFEKVIDEKRKQLLSSQIELLCNSNL